MMKNYKFHVTFVTWFLVILLHLKSTIAHSAVSYYSLSYNYLVVAVVVAEAKK